MSRTLVIGDIHGGLKALQQVLDRALVTPKDTLIFLGDYVDGWSESPQVIDYLVNLSTFQPCIFIRGNHDELLLEWLDQSKDNLQWYKHGGESTVQAYQKIGLNDRMKHIQFLKNLKNYHLDAQNRLFVHAGFTNLNGVEYEYFPKLFYWDRTLWEMALALDTTLHQEDALYPNRFKLYREIFIGHTPVTRIGLTIPLQKGTVWNVDTGAAFKGPLTVLDIDSKVYWQSDPVYQLYPNEMGRNS